MQCVMIRFTGKPNLKLFSRSLKLIASGDVQITPPPNYDYFNENFSHFKSWRDPTVKRLNENTKLIVVEGNVKSGKGKLAAGLAKHFGMDYFPDATESDVYMCTSHDPPFDLRLHNPLLPDSAKYYTGEMLWNEPDLMKNGKPLYYQYQLYMRRFFNYARALCSMLNTGRGVVMERSPFSEIAFAEAMAKCGLLSERGLRWFTQIHGITSQTLWKPHVIVHLKTPVDKLRQNIKKDNVPWEVNARNLTDNFLHELSNSLENRYATQMNRYSQIFPVDCSTIDPTDEDDIHIIADRLTELDLVHAKAIRDDYKLIEWRYGLHNDRAKINARAKFSDADLSFTRVFRQVAIPSDLHECCYDYEAHKSQMAVLSMDWRTKSPPSYNPAYSSWLKVMLNPRPVAKKNYNADLPKEFLWL